MLEVMTYSYLATDADLGKRIHLEPKLEGFSGAGHKVEFAITKEETVAKDQHRPILNGGEIKDLEKYLGFIECKKVGVEQTVNTSFKASFATAGKQRFIVPYESRFKIRFAPRKKVASEFFIQFVAGDGSPTLILTDADGTIKQIAIAKDERFIFAISSEGPAFLDNSRSLRELKGNLLDARILEIFSIDEGGIVCTLNNCLPGPQTPEKAKQASFVALDARKKRLGSFDKRPNETDFVSVLILTETSHWEPKSLRMIESCVDFNLSVPDTHIIQAFTRFEAKFGSSFYDKVSKEAYKKDAEIQLVVDTLIGEIRKDMFLDLKDSTYKKITLSGGSLAITPV